MPIIWLIAAGSIAGILLRPRDWPEAIWACSGAAMLLLLGLVPVSAAVSAAARGSDVYLFLAGMMLLAELGRREGVFDWIASVAVNAAKRSRLRLFALVYAAGVLVTVFLSNDATAVVLTPAVYASVKRAAVAPLPYLYACAFVANAASFVLPISNPANLVVYGKSLPPLISWLAVFALPSAVSVAVTFIALRLACRKDLEGRADREGAASRLSESGGRAVGGIMVTALVLMGASAMGLDLGLPTCVAAVIAVLIATGGDWPAIGEIVRGVSWSVLPLVAGLFVIVEALSHAGAGPQLSIGLHEISRLPGWLGAVGASFSVAALSNLMNNLPAGLLLGQAMGAVHISQQIRNAILVGVDLGPNLSVTGSLATVLWLIALRREGEKIDGWTFLKTGVVVMTPALLLTSLALSYSGSGA